MTRIYEEMFIVRPDIADEELDPFIEQIRTVVTTSGGTIDKVEKMGVRKLAYSVSKRDDGYYVLVQFTSNPQLVRELERRLRVSDLVMKFITVRIDEHLKRAAKLKVKKDARAARRPAPVAAPAAPAGPAVPMPGAPAVPGAPAPGQPAAEAGPGPETATENAPVTEAQE